MSFYQVTHIRERPFRVTYVVAVGNDDATVRTWTLNTPISDQLSLLSTYHGHSGPVRTVSYARMGEGIVSGSDDTEIAIWEGEGDTPIRKLRGHDGAVLSICVSGDKIFSSSEDKTIRVWDLDTGDIKSIIRGHTAPINAIKSSPDGRWIVSASDDASLRIWDSQTGELLTLPQCMPFRILTVDVSRDGKLIACGGADGQVHIWCPDMAQPAVWPDSFMRKVHGREYCPIDDQGILANASLGSDGWMRGPMKEAMCWIPPAHRQGLLQRTVGVLGTRETALDLRDVAHGTKWEQCAKVRA
jgi:WD40 repeat protein